MVLRFYIVPSVPDPLRGGETRTPKYFVSTDGISYACMDYGMHPVFLVAANIDGATHATIAANSDVTSVPENISIPVGGNLSEVRAALSGWSIPSSWVTYAMTYKVILKYIAVFFQIAQRLHGMYGLEVFPPGVTLQTTLGSLTQPQRDALTAVAASFDWDVSAATGSWTVQQLLKHMADQWNARLFIAGINMSD